MHGKEQWNIAHVIKERYLEKKNVTFLSLKRHKQNVLQVGIDPFTLIMKTTTLTFEDIYRMYLNTH